MIHETAGSTSAAPGRAPRAKRPGGWDRAHGWLLVAIDAVAVAVAVLIAISLGMVSLRQSFREGGDVAVDRALTDLALVLGWPAVLGAGQAYDRRILGLGSEEYRVVVQSAVRIVALAAVVVFVTDVPIQAEYVLTVVGLGTVISLVGRRVARKRLHRRRADGHDTRRVLAIGSETAVADLVDGLATIAYSGLRVVGAVVPGDATAVDTASGAVPVVGRPAAIDDAMRAVDADAVAIADSSTLDGVAVRRLAWSLEGRNIDLLVVPRITDVVGPRVVVRPVGTIPLLFVEEPELTGPNRLLKGVFDRLASWVALVLASPVLLLLMLLVRMTSKGPALFRQVRVGVDGRPFEILKLRTMVTEADQVHEELVRELGYPNLLKIIDDPRVTPLGRWLRRWSIDELPQLWNVAKGDMSLVGPRPGLPTEVARYEEHVSRRLLVRPGMTGLWQVSGRGDLTWEDAVRLDLHYIDNWSLTLDVQILFRTAAAVLSRRGAY